MATEEADGMVKAFVTKATEAFELFDHEQNQTVDVREIPTIVRSLGCHPTEAEVRDLLADMEDDENSGVVNLDKFISVIVKVLMERRFLPATEDQLHVAFRVLDSASKGYLTNGELNKYMTEEGEPFNEEEMEEMISKGSGPDGNFHYRPYVSYLVDDT